MSTAMRPMPVGAADTVTKLSRDKLDETLATIRMRRW